MRGFQETENSMQTWDGTKLFYRAWMPEVAPSKAIILFHRGHEHSGRLVNVVEKLDIGQDCAYFAWDARGNGKSPGMRDYAENFSVYTKDANAFVNHISEKYNIKISNMAVIANSVGAVMACSWVHDYAPPIKSLVMAAPAFRIKLYMPFAIPLLRLAMKLNVMNTVTSYVKAKVLTHDQKEQLSFNQDPLITNSIATNVLVDLHDTSTRLIDDAGAIRIPVQIHVAGSDWVVKTSAQKRFFNRLSSNIREWHYYPKLFHALFHENGKNIVIDRTRDFILRSFSECEKKPSLVHADKYGYTKREYDQLQNSSFNLFYLINKLAIQTVGKLSNGVKLGLAEGFDSGVTLDYVYKNQPGGTSPLGRLIDDNYLNSIGWQGIRQRKVNMEKLLRTAIIKLDTENKPVRIVDIAAGPGRYILDTIKEFPDTPISATLRDYKQVNIEEGKKIAKELNLENVHYQPGDAFSKQELANLSPKPTLAIISGLYELFPENTQIIQSLEGISVAVEKGGYLIYTNQPWHPQVEYIARVLQNREGDPWIMRRRTQEEMDELVTNAGFKKLAMEIDRWGIFTVSLAQKIL